MAFVSTYSLINNDQNKTKKLISKKKTLTIVEQITIKESSTNPIFMI